MAVLSLSELLQLFPTLVTSETVAVRAPEISVPDTLSLRNGLLRVSLGTACILGVLIFLLQGWEPQLRTPGVTAGHWPVWASNPRRAGMVCVLTPFSVLFLK